MAITAMPLMPVRLTATTGLTGSSVASSSAPAPGTTAITGGASTVADFTAAATMADEVTTAGAAIMADTGITAGAAIMAVAETTAVVATMAGAAATMDTVVMEAAGSHRAAAVGSTAAVAGFTAAATGKNA